MVTASVTRRRSPKSASKHHDRQGVMALSEAMNLAVRLLHNPAMVRGLRRAPLPREVTNLLEIAVGNEKALDAATAETSLSPARLQRAAGFFIEQILLHHRSDSYRVLGVERDAESAEMARHLRLLMKWLHPDAMRSQSDAAGVSDAVAHANATRVNDMAVDRSVFVSRVTGAWDTLKTKERRSTYDAQNARVQTKAGKSRQRQAAKLPRPQRYPAAIRPLLAPPNSAVRPPVRPSRLARFFRALMRSR